MAGTVDTKPIPVQTPPRRRRRRGWLVALAVLLVLAVLAVVGLVVADGVVRAEAERRIGTIVTDGLPPTVGGGFSADVRGFSALQQLAGGSFEEVVLETDDLTIAGQPADARIVARGLPVSGEGTVPEAEGWFTISQAALDALDPLADQQATPPVLGDGTVSTSIERTVLNIPITVAVTLDPAVEGDRVRLSPTEAELTSGPVTVPGTQLIQTLLPNGIEVCAARYLPPGVRLTDITVERGSARLDVEGRDVQLADVQAGRTGDCG